MERAFLFLVAAIIVGYGIACAADPTLPARLAGLSVLSSDGYAELGAMYGGLQIGVGLFLVLGACSPAWQRSALLVCLFVFGPLALLRGVSALRREDPVGSYTLGALAFESFVVIFAALLVRRSTP